MMYEEKGKNCVTFAESPALEIIMRKQVVLSHLSYWSWQFVVTRKKENPHMAIHNAAAAAGLRVDTCFPLMKCLDINIYV